MEYQELFTKIRGVNIPTIQVKNIEDEFGVKLVGDDQSDLLLALDSILQTYMVTHDGKLPDLVQLMEKQELYFKPMILNVDFFGMQVPMGYRKPSWWYFKKVHPVYSQKTKK